MDGIGEHHLKVKLARFRKSNAMFSLIYGIQTQYKYSNIMKNRLC
jgi:hypothetical protein